MTSHPKDLSDELIAAIAELPTVCEHVHLPGPVGLRPRADGDATGATRATGYLERVRALRAAVPDVALTTDLIAGFPGETDDDFEETLALVGEAQFDAAFTFVFSPRPGTAAAALPEQVPGEVATSACERLVAVDAGAGARASPTADRAHRRGAGRRPQPPRAGRCAAARGRTSTVNFTEGPSRASSSP